MRLSWVGLSLSMKPKPLMLRRLRPQTPWLLTAIPALVFGTVLWAQSGENSRLEREAEKAEAAGDTDGAVHVYAQALTAKPDWTEGWWKYGGLLYRARRFQEAGQAFGRLTRLAPNNPLGFALLGLCEYEEADWANAALHLNKALNHGGLPQDIGRVAAYDLALVLLRQRNQSGALLTLKLLFRQSPDYPGLALALGAAELNLEEPPAAGASVFPAAQIAGAAALAVLDGETAEAEKDYRDLISQYPNQPFTHLSFGLFLESHHRDDEATEEFTAETKVSTTSAIPWLWLARIAIGQKDPEAARSDVAHARKLDPDDPLSFLIEGRSLILEHHWEQALDPLHKAEDRAPQSSE